MKNLVIVESPAKAKTIEGYLGSDFVVRSCFGHIRDLPKDDTAIDIENGFIPRYEVTEDKKSVVSDLKKLSKQCETVWLATDEDREGEAIAWHLYEALDLNRTNVKRIVFHEITKKAILNAIAQPRNIDINLVDAQQARRVLDRLVGFELSPVLWRKVKPSLSAGRVQSVAVRLIVEREREINNFSSQSQFKVNGQFIVNGKNLTAELNKRFDVETDATTFLEKCVEAKFTVSSVETKPTKRTPTAPFTTSTIQQEASRKLNFSVAQTMRVAQRLYEAGHITYMRTDSVNLSDFALDAAKDQIENQFGLKYHQRRQYTNKTANAQEAHEAIRPTEFSRQQVDGEPQDQRLYDLIWKRTVASQMADAALEKTTAIIDISTTLEKFSASGEVILFDGFLRVYLESKDDESGDEENEKLLPPMKSGDLLDPRVVSAVERFGKPPARYTEASLVKKLEELGIGRPSTYASTISTVQKRGYVVKEDRPGKQRNYRTLTVDYRVANPTLIGKVEEENYGAEKSKLFPTDIGLLTTDFLIKHFERILDYNFTASVEQQFDRISNGEEQWQKMLGEFYKPFHETVLLATDNAERQSGVRNLGIDPVSGRNVYVRVARYGSVVQLGEQEDEDKKFASLRATQSVETIGLEEAMELFLMPRTVGQFEEKDMKVAIGRFGPYIAHSGAFYSLKKEHDPYTVDAPTCVEVIEAKRQADIEKLLRSFPENPSVQVLNGRWGPYLAIDKLNYKLPKGTDVNTLTLEDCLQIASQSEPSIKSKIAQKKQDTKNKAAEKKAAKKSTVKKPATKKPATKKSTTKVSPKKKK